MHNHFDRYLNLKQIILERKPKRVVECGAGDGLLTKQLASLLNEVPFELYVISDKELTDLDLRIHWITGLSYEELNQFEEGSIDLCIIDTDHNYWTLMQEFKALFSRISEGGLIAMHDVETFYHDTGMALSYWDGKPYPKEEIEKSAHFGSLGDALIEFLFLFKCFFKLVAYTKESHGAALIEKRTQPRFSIVVPGFNAVFTKKEIKEHASV